MSHVRDPVLVALGARVRELREAHGMTQSDLSVATGMNRVTLSKIEQGRQDVGAVRLTRLAAALEVAVQELFEPAHDPRY